MKRKIHFVVTLADIFVEKPIGFYGMDVPVGNEIYFTDLVIEYEQINKDPLVDAYKSLRNWVIINYPNKDYRTYYWTLEPI
jgi:hypothetical protein